MNMKKILIVLFTFITTVLSGIQAQADIMSMFDEEKTRCENILKVSKLEEDPVGIVQAGACFGELYFMFQKYDLALASYKDVYESSLAYLDEPADVIKESDRMEFTDAATRAAERLFSIYNEVNDGERAMEWIDNAMRLLPETPSKDHEIELAALIYNNKGAAYDLQGNFRQALRWYIKARDTIEPVANKYPFSLLESTILNNIGLLYFSQSDLQSAGEYFDKAYEIDQKDGDFNQLAGSLNNQCMMHRAAGKLEEAAQCYEDILQLVGEQAVYSDWYYIAMNNLGDALMAGAGETPPRDIFLEIAQSQEPVDSRLRAAAWHNLAVAELKSGQYQSALEYLEKAIALKEQIGALDYVSFDVQGEAYYRLRQLDKAKNAFEKAIQQIEDDFLMAAGSEEDRMRFFSSMVYVYKKMVLLLLEMNDPAGAVDYYERMKARIIKEIIKQGHVPLDQYLSDTDLERKSELEIILAARARGANLAVSNLVSSQNDEQKRKAQDVLDKAVLAHEQAFNEYRQFMKELYAKNEVVAGKTGNYKPPSLDKIQAALAPDQAVLAYMAGRDSTVIMLISHSDFKHYVLPLDPVKFRTQMKMFMMWKENLNTKPPDSRTMKNLYKAMDKFQEWFMGDAVAGDVAAFEKLIIVPDTFLWEIPFHAFIFEDEYLAEKHEISYSLSLELLVRPGGESRTDKLLALGDAVYFGECVKDKCMREEEDLEWKLTPEEQGQLVRSTQRFGILNRIKGTLEEVNTVKKSFVSPVVYTDVAATEANFRKSQGASDLILLSAHGVYNNSSPMDSAIALTQIGLKEDDGYLQAREVFDMTVPAWLVTLSACESARSENIEGEGMTGLVWSFLAAGAHNVVASQWMVDDDATAIFMKEFHEQIVRGATVSTALYKARNSLIHEQQYEHPFYWAPFIGIGPVK